MCVCVWFNAFFHLCFFLPTLYVAVHYHLIGMSIHIIKQAGGCHLGLTSALSGVTFFCISFSPFFVLVSIVLNLLEYSPPDICIFRSLLKPNKVSNHRIDLFIFSNATQGIPSPCRFSIYRFVLVCFPCRQSVSFIYFFESVLFLF